jgi:hypothetical protein
MFLLRAFLVWLIIIGVETVHGILRTLLLMPAVGDFRARQISVFTGSVLIFGVAYVFIEWIQARTRRELIFVGLLWVLLTVIFEVVLGRLILDLPRTRITEDYDLAQGGLLGLGLLFMAAAPILALWLRRRVKKSDSV